MSTLQYNPKEEFKNAMSLMNMKALFLYENGELDEIQSLILFSELLKCGIVWQLQGSYGRTAKDLIEAGFLTFNGEILQND